ncbi:uncharacterized protein M6B38_296245 [Iris pallida]|uniref:Protein EARLY HEADING DATE 2 n=1 Tax=Iris pallida TaxID=29817 RepID=A0AAX6HR93_IRIPA|nr:uncharacterized protein M6B38_296245 [Iris pallida]
MPVELENSSNSASAGEASVSSDHHNAPPPPPPAAAAAAAPKKKRNLPGMPDPEAEVIALSPKTLMATNRFVCEICNKGFQRDQNLQLHRRGHNLPWKLRQRTGKEVRKRVYVCPEPGCVHHEPSRALGDLTGIKKHFCRKHGEKKWKCDKCSKKYAVQSDWKAHSKTCGTREYRCDCGTLFSRRDSFITHRAFCDALAEESAKTQTTATTTTNSVRSEEENMALAAPQMVLPAQQPVPAPETQQQQQQQEPEEPVGMLQYFPPDADAGGATASSGGGSGSGASLFASLFTSAAASSSACQSATFSDFIGSMNRPEPTSLCLSTIAPNPNASLFSTPPPQQQQFAAHPPPPSPHMSATALLQKAAQMGAASTSSTFLRSFGLAPSSSSSSSAAAHQEDGGLQWGVSGRHQSLDPGLGLGLGYDAGSLMLGSSSSFFVPKPATLDLLGLGIGPGGSATGGLSSLITSMGGGGLDVGPGVPSGSTPTWEGSDRKPPAIL